MLKSEQRPSTQKTIELDGKVCGEDGVSVGTKSQGDIYCKQDMFIVFYNCLFTNDCQGHMTCPSWLVHALCALCFNVVKTHTKGYL